MSETIISCAGCGKRFKGVPSAKKFKCSGCQNIFTFPDGPREPGYGKSLCSNCWCETDWSENLSACPGCNQKIAPDFGGKAQIWAAGSSLAPMVTHDENRAPGTHQDLEARIAELTAQLALAQVTQTQLQSDIACLREGADARLEDMRQHLDIAQQEAHDRNAQALQARSELDQYRTMAVTALEPLSLEYTKRMREMIAETDKLRHGLKELREDFVHRVERVERSSDELREKLSSACREINERLSEVLGVEPDRGEVIADPSSLPNGPMAELLAAGVPMSGGAIIVTRHSRN